MEVEVRESETGPSYLMVSPEDLDMGTVALGSTTSRGLHLSNNGELPVLWWAPMESTDFALSETWGRLEANERIKLQVSFSPTSWGQFTILVKIRCQQQGGEDQECSSTTVRLEGEALTLDQEGSSNYLSLQEDAITLSPAATSNQPGQEEPLPRTVFPPTEGQPWPWVPGYVDPFQQYEDSLKAGSRAGKEIAMPPTAGLEPATVAGVGGEDSKKILPWLFLSNCAGFLDLFVPALEKFGNLGRESTVGKYNYCSCLCKQNNFGLFVI